MSSLRGFGLTLATPFVSPEPKVSYVLRHHALNRILSFTGRTIDDVVNDPIIKNEILGYYKLHKFVHRRSEILDLERQWNSLG
jgi:hypothetical protein